MPHLPRKRPRAADPPFTSPAPAQPPTVSSVPRPRPTAVRRIRRRSERSRRRKRPNRLPGMMTSGAALLVPTSMGIPCLFLPFRKSRASSGSAAGPAFYLSTLKVAGGRVRPLFPMSGSSRISSSSSSPPRSRSGPPKRKYGDGRHCLASKRGKVINFLGETFGETEIFFRTSRPTLED